MVPEQPARGVLSSGTTTRRMTVEVRIGVRNVAREVAFESSQDPEALKAEITAALSGTEKVLTLTDERGRSILVPADAVGYVEIGAPEKSKVGFGRTT